MELGVRRGVATEKAVGEKAGRRKAVGRRAVLGTMVAAAMLLVAAVAMGGCAPTPVAPSEAKAAAAETSVTQGLPIFTENNAGFLPDNEWNETYVNAGNRGCNSCHTDLQSVIDNSKLACDHPVPRSGYNTERNVTILDGCLSCHGVHTADYGNYFGDAIHTAHYSNAGFTEELDGNCWSCHAVKDTADLTDLGNTELVLWEQIMYDGALGGYPDAAENASTRMFMKYLGHETGYVTDISATENPAIDVQMAQGVTENLQDAFVALNHSGMYNEEDINAKWEGVSIVGVKNPRTFTLDDLRAMPQTTVRATNQCVVAGSAGHNVHNADYTGVTLKDLVDACGGVADGMNIVYLTGADEWNCCRDAVDGEPLEEYMANSLIALDMNGEPIAYEFGGPACFVAPGMGGAFWCKFVENIEFAKSDAPFDFVEAMDEVIPGDILNSVSAAWFQNDGETFKLADGVSLTGYAHALANSVSPLAKIQFSTDLGANWTSTDVPTDHDPLQWTTFDFNWKPETAGTYIVKVRGVNADGLLSVVPGSIIVNVEE